MKEHRHHFHYNKKFKPYARGLRNNSTSSEITLWFHILKSRKLKGYQFFRQRPILNYIADFFCKELKLVIELDGATHFGKKTEDILRQHDIEDHGYNVIRFKDEEVLLDLNGVRESLEKWIDDYESKHPEVVELNKRKKKND
jgi:very-short-patch-repair endonuclease